VLVCTPTYNEADNISELLRRVREALPDADILVLDDNSPDGTADVAEKEGAEVGFVEVLRRPSKRGLGDAYRAGFAVALARDYDIVVQIDADLSHDPAVLPQLIAAVENIYGADHDVWSVNVEEEYHEVADGPSRDRRAGAGAHGTGRDAPVLPREAIERAAATRREEAGT
jgi:dolichol-phosphate mannosyltransferase